MYAQDEGGQWHCLLPPTLLMPNAHNEDGGQTLLSLELTSAGDTKAPALSLPRSSASSDLFAEEDCADGVAWLRCRAPTAWETRRERALRAQPLAAAETKIACLAFVLQQPSPKWVRYGLRAITCFEAGPADAATAGAAPFVPAAPPPSARFPGELPSAEVQAQVAQAFSPSAVKVDDAEARLRLAAAGVRLGHMARAASWLAAPLSTGAAG